MTEKPATQRAAGGLLGRIPAIWLAGLAPWLFATFFVAGGLAAEGLIHAYVLKTGDFREYLLHPDAHEFWNRLLAVAIWFVAALLVSVVASRHVRMGMRNREEKERISAASHRFAYGDREARREMAARLHEGIAQELSAARIFMKGIPCASCGEAVTPVLETVDDLLGSAIRQCRDVAQQISPQSLDHYGLMPAIDVRAARISEQCGKPIAVSTADSTEALGRSVLLMAYDVIERLLLGLAEEDNVVSVRIDSEFVQNRLTVHVAWEGDYDPEVSIETDYAESVGASLTVDQGRSLDLSLPVAGFGPKPMTAAPD